MAPCLTTGDSGQWDKDGGYIRRKLRWVEEEGWGQPVESSLPLSVKETDKYQETKA